MRTVTSKSPAASARRRGGILMNALLSLMAGTAVMAAVLLPLAQHTDDEATTPAAPLQTVERKVGANALCNRDAGSPVDLKDAMNRG